MSAQSAISINDGQATPVSRTFSPRGADMRLAVYKDVSGGISIGTPSISIGNRETSGANGAYRTELRITVPVLETISGDAGGYAPSPKVAYTLFAKVELVSPNRSTLQNRKDILAFARGLLAHAIVTETFVDFNPPN